LPFERTCHHEFSDNHDGLSETRRSKSHETDNPANLSKRGRRRYR